jgi:hypothetical protein
MSKSKKNPTIEFTPDALEDIEMLVSVGVRSGAAEFEYLDAEFVAPSMCFITPPEGPRKMDPDRWDDYALALQRLEESGGVIIKGTEQQIIHLRSLKLCWRFPRTPEGIVAVLQRYVEEGMRTGGFLSALLANDWLDAITRADSESLDAMGPIMRMIAAYVPLGAKGCDDAVGQWIERGGMMGINGFIPKSF